MAKVSSLARVVFMGTPETAVPILQGLAAQQSGRWKLVGVVTQPDRPQGRHRTLQPSPVKALAESLALPLLQPERFRAEPESVEALTHWAPDVIVVTAFGQILPQKVLDIPKFGCLNIHFSLLPTYRGASPLATAILNGDEATGTTVMLMDKGLDTGPVLAQATMEIQPADTSLSLGERLVQQGSDLLQETLPRWLAGEVQATPQSELPGPVSNCKIWRKEDGLLDWRQPADHLERLLRASAGWPGAYAFWQGQNLKILAATCDLSLNLDLGPGSIAMTSSGLAVQAGSGCLLIQRLQLSGRKPLNAADFLRGAGRAMPGSRFDLVEAA